MFDIVGHMRLVDNITRPMRRVMSSVTSSTAGFARMSAGILGVSGALGGAVTAATLFNKTIKAAANYEMKKVTVDAMFGKNHAKNAQNFFDLVEERSAVSQFSQDEFLTAGKSFIGTTKNNKQLEKMINLAERLGAVDTEQGIDSAAFALKELFSGDGLSLSERFEIPRSALNDLKKLSLDKQLDGLDKLLNKMGATNELIDAQSKTTMGQYRKSVSQINKAFREMGMEGLAYINPLLEDFNVWMKSADFQRFKTYGIKAFGELSKGVVDSLRKAGSYIDTNFLNNPEFNKLTSIQAKVSFIFSTIMESYNAWLDKGGRDEIKGVATGVVDLMAGALTASAPLLDAAKTMGGALATGIWDGFTKVSKEKPELAALMAFMVTPGPMQVKLAASGLAVAAPGISKTVEDIKDPNKSVSQKFTDFGSNIMGSPKDNPLVNWMGSIPGFATGLNYVPYDNFVARLHEGETVLNRKEATAYRAQKNGGSVLPHREAQEYRNSGGSGGGVNVTVNGLTVREEADINRVATELYRMIDNADRAIGGAA